MFRLQIILSGRVLCFLLAMFLGLLFTQPVFAHAGVDHNNSCFITVGKTRLRISGYQFQPELEGKHFCHFFPALGPTVLAIEPLAQAQGSVSLELSVLRANGSFALLKQQAGQVLGAGLISISQTLERPGIFRLTISLQDSVGNKQQRQFIFLLGIPVTKILVIFSGFLILIVVFAELRKFKNKRT